MPRHADRYWIDWPNQRLVADGARSEEPRDFGYGSGYVVWTEGHEDGECEQFAFKSTDDWPVIQPGSFGSQLGQKS